MSGDEKDGERESPEDRQAAEQPRVAHGASAARDGRLADVLEDLEDGYYEVDLGGNFTAVNQALCRMHGLERAELLGRNNREYTEPEVAARMFETFNRVYRTGEPVKFFLYENIRADGTAGMEEISVHLIRDETGAPVGFRGITRDVTERQRNEAYEQARNRALEHLARNAPLGATLAEVLVGLQVQMPDSAGAILTVGDDGQSLDLAASMGLADHYLEQFDVRRLCPDGLLLMPSAEVGKEKDAVTIAFSADAEVKADPIAAAAGFRSRIAHPILSSEREMLGVLLVLWERDYLADPKEARWLQSATATAEIAISHHHLVSRLAYLSQRDALTGLLNRRSFIEESTRGLALARRRGWTPGLLFLDLDRFKPVNDTYGHQAGDRLLTVIADRLREVVRESDSLARLGGDEFAIFAADLPSAGAEHLARRIQARLTAPIDIGHSIEVNASIGVALAASPEDSLDSLLADADRAMYEAKSAGGGWVWGKGTGT